MCDNFVHIHNHTEYSLLDGATRIPQMVDRVLELGMSSVAITDHGVMFGAMEFYFECKKRGVKPLIGMEAYVAPQGRKTRQGTEEKNAYHLLLLARNQEGYSNLCKLHSVAALEGFYYRPRIDHDILREHSKGLISTTTCLGSEVCSALLEDDYDKAVRIAGMYRDIFDEGCYFVELQDHRLEKQARIREPLIKLAKELKLPLVATNDSHYLCKENYDAHDVLLCIGMGEQVENKQRMRFETNEFYVKSPQEMAELFSDVPEALENTRLIEEMCDLELGKSRALMPDPEVPSGVSSREFLREIAYKGLCERRGDDEQSVARLNYELEVIEKTGFEDYFLLVKEFAQHAREQGIAFGVRGSAAGSLVSFAVGITDVDPLEYDLTFERFLNIERIAMPDIDMDFADDRRDEVIKWVTEKYGTDRVAQIVTFGTLGAKAAIRDAARVLGYTPAEADKICRTIPTVPGMTIAKAESEIPEFNDVVRQDPRFGDLINVARSIEGTSRHAGVHAAGVVISKEPLSQYVPLYRGSDGQPITAYEMGILEKIGLLKMDFLGLSNLSVLARAVENVRRTHAGQSAEEHPILVHEIQEIALEDKKTFEMLSRGDTVGVFQLESSGMRRYITALKPQNVRELAAMVALYRPGPMEHIPRFIDTKFGRQKEQYLDEKMRPILEETYGVIVYQDQVLKLVQALGGFSLGKADILRRAMGKKDKDAMDSMRIEFMEGAEERGVLQKAAEQVWELLLPFAGYAFNKAHAVCYALIAYQTAYLKANYPTEYMAALMESYRSTESRVTVCIEECRRTGIRVLPPNVNESDEGFGVLNHSEIQFGMAAIKGVGSGLVRAIIEERTADGPYTHLYDFCLRVRDKGLNRTSLEALIRAGALDCVEPNRAVSLECLEGGLLFADQVIRERLAGQDSLFIGGDEPTMTKYPELPQMEILPRAELLRSEKEVMGVYLSDHPLRGLENAIRREASHLCGPAMELADGERVELIGVISSTRSVLTRAKERMLYLNLEDFSGVASCFVPPKTLVKYCDSLEADRVVKVKGQVTARQRFNSGETQIEVRIDHAEPFTAVPEAYDIDENTDGTLIIKLEQFPAQHIPSLREILLASPGNYRVVVEVQNHERRELLHRVDASEKLVSKLKSLVRKGEVQLLGRGSTF